MWPGWCNESTESCNHGRYRHCQVDDGVLSLLLPWDPTSQPRSRIWRKKSWATASVSGQFLGVQELIVWLQPKQWMIRVTTNQNLRRPAELMTAYSLHYKSMKYVILSKNPSFLCFLMPPWSILITFWSTYYIYTAGKKSQDVYHFITFTNSVVKVLADGQRAGKIIRQDFGRCKSW